MIKVWVPMPLLMTTGVTEGDRSSLQFITCAVYLCTIQASDCDSFTVCSNDTIGEGCAVNNINPAGQQLANEAIAPLMPKWFLLALDFFLTKS